MIWGVLLPVCWYVFHASSTAGNEGMLYPILVVFSFLDGVNVAFANVVDVDMGGVDLLAKQHGLPVTDSLRIFFNTVHQMVFDASMVLFTPGMAFFSWYLADVLSSGSNAQSSILGDLSVRDATTGGMVLVFAGTFLVMSLVSMISYCCYIPSASSRAAARRQRLASLNAPLVGGGRGGSGEGYASPGAFIGGYEPVADDDDALVGGGDGDGADGQRVSCCGLLADIMSGLRIMCANPPVRWRILFVGLEVALEDAMVAVMLPEYALTEYDMCKGQNDCVLPLWFGPQHNGHAAVANASHHNIYNVYNNGTTPSSNPRGNHSDNNDIVSADGAPICASIWTALLIGFGKLAAVLAAGIFHRCWTVPEKPSGYRPLFVLIFLSSASTVLLPLSRIAAEANYNAEARIMIFAATFLFFLFSAPAKIGLETLLQGLAADLAPDIQGKIFGVIGTAVTSIDALIVLAMTLVFGRLKRSCPVGSGCEEHALTTALWVASGIYIAHGVLELIIGPWLMLPAAERNGSVVDDGAISKPEPFSSPRPDAGATTMFPASPQIGRSAARDMRRNTDPWER
jgi:hypothetical protein